MNHPFHRDHALSLLTNPAYQSGIFICNACRETGNGSSYHCGVCNFDLHVLCACKPLLVTDHQSHHHQLALSVSPPYHSKMFTCNICRQIGSNQWLYRCEACQFDAHLSCVNTVSTVTASPSSIQTASRAPPPPGITPLSMHQLPHQPILHPQVPAGQNQNPAATTLIGQGNLLHQAIGRLVTGASQQVGVSIVQGLLGGGGGGDHGGHGGGGGSRSTALDSGAAAGGSSLLAYDNVDTGTDWASAVLDFLDTDYN